MPVIATSHSYSMHSRKQVGVLVDKRCLASNTHILYATAVETIWAKQCTKTCKAIIYSNFEAFDFTFDMHLYYIHIYFYAYFKSIYNVD